MEELERSEALPCPKDDYKPSKNQILQEYEIRIKFLSRGCIVSVGCKEIAFENVSEALGAFNLYVTNPYEEQQKWRKVLD